MPLVLEWQIPCSVNLFETSVGTTCVTDAETMAVLARGDIQALDGLVTRHNDRAQRLAYGVLRDASRTHDVVADAFLAVADTAARFDLNRPFAPWFDRIVIDLAIKDVQREFRRRRITELWRRPIELNDPSPSGRSRRTPRGHLARIRPTPST